LLADAVTGETAGVVAKARNIPPDQKAAVKAELTKIRDSVSDPQLKEKLDAVLSVP
jgi:hypothetical protein